MTAPRLYLSQLRAWGLRIVVARPLLVLTLFMLPLCSFCLAGSTFSAIIHHGDAETTNAAQRLFPLMQTRWPVMDLAFVAPQGPDLDYSKFLHSSQRHSSLACTDCHERNADNSALPGFPGHKQCTGCHLGQFTTPAVPMCLICHTDTSGGKPPLRGFPATFKESFNVRFDHAQHMIASARPQNGCVGCHGTQTSRGFAFSIPATISAHNQCYSCHTPNSKSAGGREIASCGVCHNQTTYSRTATSARAFRYSFSHAKHGPRERLACSECHNITGGLPQSRQVSSPTTAEHFPMSRGTSCVACHNGKRAFGGDLAFKDCRRCHIGASFRMPL
jgi:c(7)-type cytochrome triheme protein